MKYYYCVSKMMVIDFDKIDSFISERIVKNGIDIITLSFNDNNYIDFLDKSGIGKHFTEKDNYIIVLGEDNNLYKISVDGLEQIKNFKNTITLKKYIQSTYKLSKIIKADEDYRQNIISKYNPEKINKTGNGFAKYDKYVYIDKCSGIAVPYRFRKARRKNRPLVVYFGGTGTIGHDNFKQFFEHITLGQTLKLIKADCNILVPQFTRQKFINESYCREIYTDAVTNLITELQSENDIDSKRIYIYGCSFGGGLTWNMLVNHHDMITGAIELMGEYYGYKRIDEIDFEKIAKVPIWMAHSVNDNVVNIESDDKFYQKLTAHNGNVKYTRPNKYAHKLAGVFLRNEKWAEWLLNQQISREESKMIKIMFVCHGNICRSPMAEFILKDMVKKKGLQDKFLIRSSATSTEEICNGIGNLVYPPAKDVLEKHKINPTGKRAVQLKESDYDEYDLFIGMDSANIRNMKRILGGDKNGKIHKLMEYANISADVFDPWYTRDFDKCYSDIYKGCEALFKSLI